MSFYGILSAQVSNPKMKTRNVEVHQVSELAVKVTIVVVVSWEEGGRSGRREEVTSPIGTTDLVAAASSRKLIILTTQISQCNATGCIWKYRDVCGIFSCCWTSQLKTRRVFE